MPKYKVYFLYCFLFFVLPFQSEAQFNFGVGYSIGKINPEIDRGITKTFNENNSWLEDKLEPINVLQGLHLSLRYRWEFVAFDFTWRNRFRTKQASGIDPATNATFKRKLTHRYISYSLGIENFIGAFSYGGSIDFENLALRTEVTGVDGDFNITNDYGLGSHFFVAYNLDAGDFLDFSIRPYVHIPWQKYNIAAVAEELNGDISSSSLNENYINFGIMFIFYNGNKD